MRHLPWFLAMLLLAGCTSIPYDKFEPYSFQHDFDHPGLWGITPSGKAVSWTWQSAWQADSLQFRRDNEMCSADSWPTAFERRFLGITMIERYEDCMVRLGYQLVQKRASGEPVPRRWGRSGWDLW